LNCFLNVFDGTNDEIKSSSGLDLPLKSFLMFGLFPFIGFDFEPDGDSEVIHRKDQGDVCHSSHLPICPKTSSTVWDSCRVDPPTSDPEGSEILEDHGLKLGL
jgi:hypothetical protein